MNQPAPTAEFHSFGDWLRRRRKALDWTQATLAQRVGCTAATIRKIEADERKPSQQLAELLVTALGVPDNARAAFLQAARQVQVVTELPSPSATPVAASFSKRPLKLLHNLPVPMTSLVDRVRDAAAVAGLLRRADVRLLTLLGPPGIGKTRLCIYAAEQVATAFADGVWFVDLAPLTDAALVLPTIAYGLSLAETGATPLLERLCTTLAEKELLLVLDNCEQVSAAATAIGVLLRSCPGLKVLATSRTPLLLAGEHEYVLPPLSLPPRDIATQNAGNQLSAILMTYEAVALFVARVRQHQQAFAVTAENGAQITTICLRLEGIPLALELAAAALRRMTLAQLAALLQEETTWLHELHSPARDLPPRQRTLYQAIAWSYSLLDANQQMIFRQLGVFVGGVSAAAAQAVCAADQKTLTLLTEHNLLVRAPGRWQMLAMIREFALVQMGNEERTVVQQRHVAYFVAQADLKLAVSLEAIAQDHDNFRTALAAAIAAQDTHAALTLCLKLSWFWETHGYLREGMSLACAALALPAIGDPHLRFETLERVASLAWQRHQFDMALSFVEQMTTLAHSTGDQAEMARALAVFGRILIEQGAYARAEAVLQENAALAHQIPHLFNPGCPLAQLGEVALARGDWATAQTYLTQALTRLTAEIETLYTGVSIAIAHTDLAELALVQDDPGQARHELRQVLPYARLYMRRLHCLLVTLAGLLLVPLPTAQTKTAQAAATVLGAIAGLGERTGDTLSPFHQRLIAERCATAKQLLSQPEWQAAWTQGHAWTPAQAADAAEQWLGGGYHIVNSQVGVYTV